MHLVLCGLVYLAAGLLIAACSKKDLNFPRARVRPLCLDSLKTLDTDLPDALYSGLVFTNERTGLAAAPGWLARTTDGGRHWVTIPLPVSTPVARMQFTDEKTGNLISGDQAGGCLLKTTDGGLHWRVIRLEALACPYGMYFLDSRRGFITGKNLFIRTTDGGEHWSSLKSPGFRMFQDVGFRDGRTGYASSYLGGYFRTRDGGRTWDSLHLEGAGYLYDLYFPPNQSLVERSPDSLVDLDHQENIIRKPVMARKLLYLDDQRCIGVGSHYEDQGFYPYGDLLVTNDNWSTWQRKIFSPGLALTFSALARINDHQVMILGAGYGGTKVMVLNF
ncbi:MAG TPA: YCF48-related protein [Chitinophagaceae bacterium]|nr:YCF48-related protein [Chitinophagaceae bacterium]